MSVTLFVLGGAGFIGREVVSEALAAGQRVKALVRTANGATRLREAGAEPVMGDARQPETWISAVQGASTIIELLQPQLPRCLSRSAIRAVARERQSLTQSILEGLRTVPGEQPVYFSISGADDLQPDEHGALSHRSGLRAQSYGFGLIGLPVRKLVDASGHAATYVYLGNLVYGPGKIFADQYVAGLAAGRAHIVGRGANRLPLTHVTDAARALVHLSQLPRSELVGRTYIAMDGSDATQRQLLEYTAACMGVKRPSAVPEWLGALVAGRVAVETITLDAHADPSALLATGFAFRYPSYREGVPATLARLGRLADTAAAASGGHVA